MHNQAVSMEPPKRQARLIPISECFRTIQGEGAVIGRPTVFVRVGGCDYQHCRYCDTLYAVLPENRHNWTLMSVEEIFAEVQRLAEHRPILITVSGGNPAMQPLEGFIDLAHKQGYSVALETQGSIPQPWFSKLDILTLSPKAPSMYPAPATWERLDRCVSHALAGSPQVNLKLVIFDDEDYIFARNMACRYPMLPVFLQVGNATPPHLASEGADIPALLARLNWLIERVLSDGWYTATILPQLHVLLWNNKRGV